MLSTHLAVIILLGFGVFALIVWWCVKEITRLTVRVDELEDKLSNWQDVDIERSMTSSHKLKFKNIKHVRY